jgi:hypothetical protein
MPKAALWTLRLSIAALALASARNAWVPGSAINSWLFMEAGLPESVASGIDRLGAAIMVGVVISALVRPSRVLLLTGATWMLCVALARWDNPGATADELAPLSHAVRIGALLALALLSGQPELERRSSAVLAGWVLLLGTSLTFVGHGIEALQHSGPFVDLMIGTVKRWTGQRLSQASAEQLLTVIGLQDFLLAALLLLRRWRWIAGWMAIWGLATALSRVTSMGVDSWHQSLLRLANGGVPLTLYLAWHHLIRSSSTTRKP